MDRNEVEHVARVSGKEAAQETLLGLGIDATGIRRCSHANGWLVSSG